MTGRQPTAEALDVLRQEAARGGAITAPAWLSPQTDAAAKGLVEKAVADRAPRTPQHGEAREAASLLP